MSGVAFPYADYKKTMCIAIAFATYIILFMGPNLEIALLFIISSRLGPLTTFLLSKSKPTVLTRFTDKLGQWAEFMKSSAHLNVWRLYGARLTSIQRYVLIN